MARGMRLARRGVLAGGTGALLSGCAPGAGTIIEATRQLLDASLRDPVALDERFTSNRNQWPVGEHASLEPAGYRIRPNVPSEPPRVYFAGPGVSRPAASIVADATVEWAGGGETPWYGITTRYSPDTGARYQLVINPEGRYSLQFWTADEVVQLIPWRASSALRPRGEANRLTLAARGETLAVSLNGSYVGRVADSRIAAAGYAPFVVRSGAHIVAKRWSVRTARAEDEATAQPAFVLHDALVDNRGRWLVDDEDGFTGTFSVAGYQIVTEYDRYGNEWWSEPAGAPVAQNVSVSAEVEIAQRRQGDAFCGVALRAVEAGDYGYQLLLDGAGKFAVRKVHPRFRTPPLIVPWTASGHIKAGSNVIRLTALGDDIAAEINDQRVAYLKDGDLPDAGVVHLVVSDGMRLTVRNFEAREALPRSPAAETQPRSTPRGS